MFISIVREALETSVTWAPLFTPPVRFQISQVSTVPKRRRSCCSAAFTFGWLSNSQRSLSAEKYGDKGRPQRGCKYLEEVFGDKVMVIIVLMILPLFPP